MKRWRKIVRKTKEDCILHAILTFADDRENGYRREDSLLVRSVMLHDLEEKILIVLLKSMRNKVLTLAHEGLGRAGSKRFELLSRDISILVSLLFLGMLFLFLNLMAFVFLLVFAFLFYFISFFLISNLFFMYCSSFNHLFSSCVCFSSSFAVFVSLFYFQALRVLITDALVYISHQKTEVKNNELNIMMYTLVT